MRGRKRWLVITTCAVSLLLLLAAFTRSKEPSYAGQPLSSWVTELAIVGYRGTVDADSNAIVHMGTNALPLLLKWLHYERPLWRAQTAYLIEEHAPRYALFTRAADRIHFPKRAQLASGASDALKFLGPTALPALNELTRLMNDPTAPQTATTATEVLCYLGTNALPALIPVLKNPEHPCRYFAVSTIGEMPGLSEAAASVIPALTACLDDTNAPIISVTAAHVLAQLKCEPNVWIPTLTRELRSTNAVSQVAAATTLEALAAQAASAIPALTNALRDSNPEVRSLAAQVLHEIAPEQFTNAARRF